MFLKRVVDALKLEAIDSEKLRIATFGNQKQEVQAVNLIKLAFNKPSRQLRHGSFLISPKN